MRPIIVVALFAAGCAHSVGLAPVEQCGTVGMVVDGIAFSSGAGASVATSPGGVAFGRSNSNGESVSCRRPTTPEETCEARAGAAAADVTLQGKAVSDARDVYNGVRAACANGTTYVPPTRTCYHDAVERKDVCFATEAECEAARTKAITYNPGDDSDALDYGACKVR